MSYVQETHVAATRVEMVDQWSLRLSTRAALMLLLLLAFLHGALYALFLPPWGLIDEAQHLHYIQYIAEQQSLPVAGNLYLSDEIIDSLFATHRWQTFHWTPPPAPEAQVMGLEGHSYEAYQPPLFYLAMTPLYMALPSNMLVKVYGLRIVVVILSLITVWAIYRTSVLLLPQFPRFPFFAGLLLVAIPERAIATSRINNDVMVEVMAALFFVVLTHSVVAGLTTRRSLLLGLLLGLAAWTKLSGALLVVPLLLLLWLHRQQQSWWKQIGWMALSAIPLGLGLAIRNLWLYNDLTGFAAFEQLHRLAAVDTSFAGFVRALVSLLNHFWLVWWKGSNVGQNALLAIFYGSMAIVLLIAWVRLCLDLWRQQRMGGFATVLSIYALTILLYFVAVMNSYYQGMVPVIQGRFMLPAMLPFVLIFVCGLWRMANGRQMILAVTAALWAMGLISLFGNLVPYFYFWSGVVQGDVNPQQILDVGQWLATIYQRLLLDKPPFVVFLLPVVSFCFASMLILTWIVTFQTSAAISYSHHSFPRSSRLSANPAAPGDLTDNNREQP